jgi:hypothetical protein
MEMRALWSQTKKQEKGLQGPNGQGRFWTFIFVQKAKTE